MSKILIIEPDNILASEYQKALSKQRLKAFVCSDGQQAITAADKQAPDAILLELALAKNSGIEFIYEFRSYADWRDIPIVVLSRLSQTQANLDEKTMTSLGIIKYHYKPETSLKHAMSSIEIALQSKASTK